MPSLYDNPYMQYINPREPEKKLVDYGGDLLDMGLSVLDAPGGMARNVLAGQDMLKGLFDSSQRATGQDVLKNMGSENPSELAGLMVDILADPLLLAGPGRAMMKGAYKGAKGVSKGTLKALSALFSPVGVKKAAKAARAASTHSGASAKAIEDLALSVLNEPHPAHSMFPGFPSTPSPIQYTPGQQMLLPGMID